MKFFRLFAFLFILCINANAQTNQRISLSSATDATFPQSDYAGYLTDNFDSIISPLTGQDQYSTVVITLQFKCIISKLSLYDLDGIFTVNPAWLYAINGKDTTYIGAFTGEQYGIFTDLFPGIPMVATKIALRKFGNNIPQKIQVFGQPYQAGTPADASPLRLVVDSVISAINTGMNYTPWLNDNLLNLVASAWGSINNQYVDVRLKLNKRSQVSKISLYDYTGVFTTNPAYVYLQKDTSLQLVGKFEGLQYQVFVPYNIPEGLQGDAVIIRKYGNNIPQKVQVFGRVLPDDPSITTPVVVIPPPVDTIPTPVYTKIPIEGKRWYILNYAPLGISSLFNGVTNESINTGFASFHPAYECLYPLNDGEAIRISQVKMFDYSGSFTANPAQLFAITKDGRRIQLGSFTGSKYNQWVGPYPDRNTTGPAMFNLDSTISNIQYIGISCTHSDLPTEIEFYGTYTPPTAAIPPVRNFVTFNKTLGMNGFEWDFVRPNINSRMIAEDKYAAIKNFTGFRHYLDWKQLEGTEGKYSFNPSNAGGWDYDMTYERCKRDSIEVLACIKNTPDWMVSTYPSSIAAADNAPLKYGRARDSVQSYVEKGRVAFQFTARYGRNANIPLSLIKVNTQPRWTNDPPNVVKVGLGLVKYVECGNELDKWWKGTNGYMNPYEYATLLSAFYDGHKGLLGNDVGVKNADSTMQVVMSGLAFDDPSYVRGMIEWCRQNRGYKANGKIDLCWDVINYHHYSNDAASSQQGSSTRGAAPEVSDAVDVARSFVTLSEKFANSMPVWITELGFDINQGSPQKAIVIGNKTVLQTQADWILRSALTYLREGISSLFFYELKDYNINNATKFASMGLTDSFFQRRPAMDYLYQTNQLLSAYHFNRSLQQLPVIDEYEKDGKLIYAVWIPDEKDTTLSCSIAFPYADSVIVYKPVAGSNQLQSDTLPVINGTITLMATETPLFVTVKPTAPNQMFVIFRYERYKIASLFKSGPRNRMRY